MAADTTGPSSVTSRLPVGVSWLAALAAGVLVGVLTSYLQGVLPGSWNRLANSGAVWSALAFGVAVRLASSRAHAVGAGLFGLLGSVAGYYALAAPLRDVATSWDERLLWTLAALILGPLVGVAAYVWVHGRRLPRCCAGLVVCGIAAGEALHALARISSSDSAGWVEFLIAVVVAGLLLRGVRDPRETLTAIGFGAGTALLVFLAYGVLAVG